MAITPLPTPPSRSDTQNFSSRADAFLGQLPQFGVEANALASDVNAKQSQVAADTLSAQESAANALASANNASASSNAAAWVSGNTYALNVAVISQVDFLIYRKKTASSVTVVDPANDATNWVLAYGAFTPATANTQTSSTDITLTATSPGLQVLTFTARGRHVTLPSCLTLSKQGGPLFEIKNDGGYPFGVRDADGSLLTAVLPGGIAYIALSDRSTVAGKWHITGTNLEPGLILLDTKLSTAYGNTNLNHPSVALDSNVSIHVINTYNSNGFAVIAVDTLGKQVTTPLVVTTETSYFNGGMSMFKVDSTRAVVFWTGAAGGAGVKGAVISLNGSSGSYSLSLGTIVTGTGEISSAYAWKDLPYKASRQVVQLSSSLFLAGFNNASNHACCRAISVSGTTVTFGAVATIVATNDSLVDTFNVVPLTATTGLVTWKASLASTTPRAVVVSVSGTTCTPGTYVTLTGLLSSISSTPSTLCKLTPTRVFVLDDNGTATTPYAVTLNISGTTVAVSATVQIESAQVMTSNGTSPDNYQANPQTPRLTAISSTQAFGWISGHVSYYGCAFFLKDNDLGAPIVDGKTYGITYQSNQRNAGYGRYLAASSTEVITLQAEGASGTQIGVRAVANKLNPAAVGINGVTTGTGVELEGLDQTAIVDDQTSIKLPTGDYLVGLYQSRAINVLRSNGEFVQHRGCIQTPAILSYWTTPVLGNNKIVCVGNLKYGEVATSGGQTFVRIMAVEVAK